MELQCSGPWLIDSSTHAMYRTSASGSGVHRRCLKVETLPHARHDADQQSHALRAAPVRNRRSDSPAGTILPSAPTACVRQIYFSARKRAAVWRQRAGLRSGECEGEVVMTCKLTLKISAGFAVEKRGRCVGRSTQLETAMEISGLVVISHLIRDCT